jgi:peptidyl-prolyl cis-trans isomerase SurA
MKAFNLRATLVFTSLLLALAVAGCNREEKGTDVLAKVNGEKISRADVDKYYNNQTSGSPQKPSGDQEASLRLNILRQLIDDQIMMQRARKMNLMATDEEVDAKFAEFKAPYTQEEFDRHLKERNLTSDDLKRDLRRSLTFDKIINKEITSKINISDADIAQYYNDHKSEFNFIEPQYHLAQIVVTTAPMPQVGNLKNDKAANESEAKAKVKKLTDRIETGEDFATIAMNYSEQPETSPNGGDMGFIPESSLKNTPGMQEVLTRLKPGGVTQPIPVVDPDSKRLAGFRIIKLITREPAGQRDLNDPRVQAAIRQQLRERREQLLKAAYYDTLRNDAKVENYYAEEMLKNTGAKK